MRAQRDVSAIAAPVGTFEPTRAIKEASSSKALEVECHDNTQRKDDPRAHSGPLSPTRAHRAAEVESSRSVRDRKSVV